MRRFFFRRLLLLAILAHNLIANRWWMSTMRWESHDLCSLITTIFLCLHWELCLHAGLFLLMSDWSQLAQLLEILLFALIAITCIIVGGRQRAQSYISKEHQSLIWAGCLLYDLFTAVKLLRFHSLQCWTTCNSPTAPSVVRAILILLKVMLQHW